MKNSEIVKKQLNLVWLGFFAGIIVPTCVVIFIPNSIVLSRQSWNEVPINYLPAMIFMILSGVATMIFTFGYFATKAKSSMWSYFFGSLSSSIMIAITVSIQSSGGVIDNYILFGCGLVLGSLIVNIILSENKPTADDLIKALAEEFSQRESWKKSVRPATQSFEGKKISAHYPKNMIL